MSSLPDARPATPGAQGVPEAPIERNVVSSPNLLVGVVTKIFEWTSFCTSIPGAVHRTRDGKVIYTEPDTVIDCRGSDPHCLRYPSKLREDVAAPKKTDSKAKS